MWWGTADKNYHPDFKCNNAVHTTSLGQIFLTQSQKRQSVFIAIWWLSAEAQYISQHCELKVYSGDQAEVVQKSIFHIPRVFNTNQPMHSHRKDILCRAGPQQNGTKATGRHRNHLAYHYNQSPRFFSLGSRYMLLPVSMGEKSKIMLQIMKWR